MSVTFSCPAAPTRQVPCEWCARYAVESPEYLVDGKCDKYCTGMQTEYTSPLVNLSGYNAAHIQRLLGLPRDEYGSLPVSEVPDVLRRILRVLNVDQDRAGLVEDSGEERGALGARMVSFGNTDEDTTRRLTSMRTLLIYAVEHGFDVAWE